jgi:hypothetical protein
MTPTLKRIAIGLRGTIVLAGIVSILSFGSTATAWIQR